MPLLPALESCVGLFAADRPHAAPALAEGPREGRGLRGEMVPHAQAAAAQRHAPARSRRPAGCRRKRLVTRNRDNGARSLPCRHVRQPSRPASHLASPAAKIGKFPTALIRCSALVATWSRRSNRRRSHGHPRFGYCSHWCLAKTHAHPPPPVPVPQYTDRTWPGALPAR